MKIFISYSWKNKNFADLIDDTLRWVGITPVRDVRDVLYKESIKEFMKRVRSSDFVIMIISEEFLKSYNSMNEVLEFVKDENYKNRIIPIIVTDEIFDPNNLPIYIKYWEQEYTILNSKIKTLNPENSIEVVKRLKILRDISSTMGPFLEEIQDMKCFKIMDETEQNFVNVLNIMGYKDFEIRNEFTNIRNIANLNEQEIQLSIFLAKYPMHKAAHFQRAMIKYKKKDYEMSKLYLEDILSNIDKEDTTAMNALGVILMENCNEIKTAEELFNNVLKIRDANYGLALTNLGYLYHEFHKDHKNAVKYLIEAIAIEPSNDRALTNLGRIFADVLNEHTKAKELYELAILLNPQNKVAHYNLAQLLETHFGQFSEAVEEYKKVLEIEPDDFRSHYRLGVNYVEKLSDLESAKNHYERVIELDPDNEFALSNLGFVFNELGQYDKEELLYLKAIALNPNFSAAHNNLARLYMNHLKVPSRAKEEFEICLKLEPDNPFFNYNYSLLVYMGYDVISFEKGREHYIKAKSLNKNLTSISLDAFFQSKIIII